MQVGMLECLQPCSFAPCSTRAHSPERRSLKAWPPPQVVRKALDEGYEVRCTVRPRMNPADFLRDWGATTVQVCRPLLGTLGDALLSGATRW